MSIREITPETWKDQPVIALFGADERACYVGVNGIAALNSPELAAEAFALVHDLQDKLMLQDLGFVGDDIESMSATIDLDAEDEEEEIPAPSGHNFFTCPPELAGRAIFLRPGMVASGRSTNGQEVSGHILEGAWQAVNIYDGKTKHYNVPISSLKLPE